MVSALCVPQVLEDCSRSELSSISLCVDFLSKLGR